VALTYEPSPERLILFPIEIPETLRDVFEHVSLCNDGTIRVRYKLPRALTQITDGGQYRILNVSIFVGQDLTIESKGLK
jgi:hypothetical protein